MLRHAALILLAVAALPARSSSFGVLDIALGASESALARQLDFRDINEALAQAQPPGKPGLGARGYGCLTRDDAFADTSCVSHTETVAGIETREIRLTFLEGRLQQFSLSAEARHSDAVTGYLRQHYGEPRSMPAPDAGAMPRLQWENEAGRITSYRGNDLVFVNFELLTYAEAVRRRRERPASAICR
jgi:hypothetical protein